MKKGLYIFAVITAVVSCKSRNDIKSVVPVPTPVAGIPSDSSGIGDSHYFWSVNADAKQDLILQKSMPLKEEDISVRAMVDTMNLIYPDIVVKIAKISNDTVFLRIPKSKYLTTGMGSTGAEAYMAELVYNVTEVKGVGYVDINFKTGDRAEPGTYARVDFIDMRRP